LAQSFGETGLVLFIVYRLVNRWAGAFLGAQTQQAQAMMAQATSIGSLAATVQNGQADQREVLIAVRVLAEKIETHKDYLKSIERAVKKEAQE